MDGAGARLGELQLQPIVQQFTSLLNPSSGGVFGKQLEAMVSNSPLQRRLVVNLDTVRSEDAQLAAGLVTKPTTYLPAFDKALQDLAVELEPSLLKDPRAVSELHVAVDGSFGRRRVGPRELSSALTGQLVCLVGIVTRCTNVRPKLTRSVQFCAATTEFHEQHYRDPVSVANYVTLARMMPANGGGAYKTKDDDGNALEMEYGLSWFSDSQRMTIQEMPESAPPGQLPRSVDVVLDGDLVDSAKPGDRVTVVGIYRAAGGAGVVGSSGVFKAILVGNLVKQLPKNAAGGSSFGAGAGKITANDVRNIRKIAGSRKAFSLLANSMAPSIFGFGEIKRALLLLLLGGAEKNLASGTHLRGDINMLMVGDPSTAKSQLLRFVLKTAPLAISTTGRGSSGVGLTAAVGSDPDTGERHLEAGAMVLADRGVVCIDEFDKMSDEDRVAIHEVMEQQTVTIAKAGIHASLNARCSVVAAANPLYGSYDRSKKPHENIALPDSLLSRFDLLFIVLDHISPDSDRAVADHVLRVHQHVAGALGIAGQQHHQQAQYRLDAAMDAAEERNAASNAGNQDDGTSPVYEQLAPKLYTNTDGEDVDDEVDPNGNRSRRNARKSKQTAKRVLSVAFVKKYIQYAKNRVKPELSLAASEYIAKKYAELRTLQKQLTLPITARSLETMIRLATAHAKLRLSSTVEQRDAKVACGILKFSLGAQTELQDEADETRKRKLKRRREEMLELKAGEGGERDDDGDESDAGAGGNADGNGDSARDRDNDKDGEENNEAVDMTVAEDPQASGEMEAEEEEEDGEGGEDDEDRNHTSSHADQDQAGDGGATEKVTELVEAVEAVKSSIADLMGRQSTCSKSELETRLLRNVPKPLSGVQLFEQALDSLANAQAIVVHQDTIFRV